MRLKKQKPFLRSAGVLLPISSLPSPHGIGTFGEPAYAFVDFLKKMGQSYWQVLPLGPTGYGDSPYQSCSAFAGNPYFIDLDFLVKQGLLKKDEVTEPDWKDGSKSSGSPDEVDYNAIYENRFTLLQKAYERSAYPDDADYQAFLSENEGWLVDYADYMAIKLHFENRSWTEWPDDIRLRRSETLERFRKQLKKEIGFWRFCQYLFYSQWKKLKTYANENGIKIIGDIPIYVALDSSDVWVNGYLFQLDEDKKPIAVAGVPPDMFSATGQLWGNPLYNWAVMEKDDFAWWKKRILASAALYDVIRIDHFIGIVRYYSIPAEEKTAMNGTWKEGPGKKLLQAFGEVLTDTKIIAEDLGLVTPEVRRVKDQAGYPGMKLMEFGFDAGAANTNLPIHFEQNCVVYGGTHDNETLAGYFEKAKRREVQFAKRYLQVKKRNDIPWAIIRAAYASVANTAVFQMQDFLTLDNSARMNYPSTIGGNWQWRLLPDQLTDELAARVCELAQTYGRLPEPLKTKVKKSLK